MGKLGNYLCNEARKTDCGCFLQGAKDEDVPEALTNYGHALVGWNSNRIADAINGEDLWMDSTGVPKKESDVLRSTC